MRKALLLWIMFGCSLKIYIYDIFDYLVGSVLTNGVEIWKWEEKSEVEALQARYIKRAFGLDKTVYIVSNRQNESENRKDNFKVQNRKESSEKQNT